jgi:uncharacterized membrane protein
MLMRKMLGKMLMLMLLLGKMLVMLGKMLVMLGKILMLINNCNNKSD